MTKVRQFYVGPNEVTVLGWVSDGAIIYLVNDHSLQSPRWVKLSDIEIRWQ